MNTWKNELPTLPFGKHLKTIFKLRSGYYLVHFTEVKIVSIKTKRSKV